MRMTAIFVTAICLDLVLLQGACALAFQEQTEAREPRSSPKVARTDDGLVQWPMRMNKGRPIPVIEATVNGEGPFLFYLDTGASVTTLDTAFVEKMKLPVTGKTRVQGPGQDSGIESDIVLIEQFQMGGIHVEEFEAAAFDRSSFSGGEDLAGSLGLSVFGELPFEIDYSNDQITVGGDGLPEADGKSVLSCKFDGPVPFFEIQLGNDTFDAAFDSGFAGLLLVGEETAKKLTFPNELEILGKARTVSGEYEIMGGQIDGDLKVGDQTTANPNLAIMPTILVDREICVLGLAWGSGMSITYDKKNGRVRFRKPHKPLKTGKANAANEYAGSYGLRTVFLDEDRLMYRREGGPAIELKPIEDDLFELVIPAGAQTSTTLPNVRFERDENMKIKGFSLVRGDEVEEYVAKDDSP